MQGGEAENIDQGSAIAEICCNDAVDMILAALPIETAIKCRSVCKEWDSLITSSYFTNAWKAQHTSSSPYLLFDISSNKMLCMIYSLTSETWFKISLSFLPLEKDIKWEIVGSTAGLLLILFSNRLMLVCNPMRQTYVSLPSRPRFSVEVQVGIVNGREKGSYKVFAIGIDYNHLYSPLFLEVYDSSSNSWHTAGEIPDSGSKHICYNDHIIFSNGFFFSLLYNMSDRKHSMIYGNAEQIDSNISEIELPEQRDRSSIHYNLPPCGSSLLVVALTLENHKVNDVLIWEFEFDNRISNPFKRILVRIPTSIMNDLTISSSRYIGYYKCWGLGDLLCFRKGWSEKLLVYNRKEPSWHWIPECPEDGNGRYWFANAMVFDMAESLSY